MPDFAQAADEQGSRRGLELSETYEFRWRRRYNLAPTDPRYLDMTFAELLVDCWAHAHVDDPKLREMSADDDFDATLQELGIDDVALAPLTPEDTEVIEHESYAEAPP